MPPSVAPHVLNEDLISRPTSAPPVVTHAFEAPQPVHTPQYDVDSAKAFRADPAYSKWYYSQNPRDPRLPPPIVRPQPHTAHPGMHFKEGEEGKVHVAAPAPHAGGFSATAAAMQSFNDSAYQKGLVAMIQDDFPRTPSPVYGKEVLSHAAALAAANQAAALSLDLGPHIPNDQMQHLNQAMQALNFQHVPPPQHGQHMAPLTQAQQPQHLSNQVSSMPYGHPAPKLNVPQPVPGQQPGWAPQMQPIPSTQGMMQPNMQQVSVGAQSNQYYQHQQPPSYPPHIMQGYGAMQMPFGEAEQPQPSGYYLGGFDQHQQHLHMHQQRQHQPMPVHQHQQHTHPHQHQHLQGSPMDKPKKGGRRDRGHDDVPRTRLMEEFRSMKARRWEIQDLVGHMVEFSRDQEGSRLIQRKLEGCSDAEKDLVFSEVYKEALGLMTDVFGNYVIQKLFEHGLPRHRKMLAGVLKGNVLSLTLQTYGCRVIQKALEVIDEDDQTMVASELDGHVLRCVLDQNGNHVIQKCIERIPPQNVIFIVQSFIGNVQNLAVHAYGCRVIQRILEYCEDHHEVISPILDEILDNVHILARDQYGNYVVQHVLINGKPIYQAAIIERLRADALELAQHKFASNVVEKMFHYGTRDDRNAFLGDLLRVNADGTSALHVMMRDQYANYVVQKIIDLADESQRRQIIDHIKPHIATLRRYTYGKHIIARIEKLNTGGKGGGVPPQ
eukprot:EG_transcript_2598